MPQFAIKHGKSRDAIYKLWTAMIQRCENPKAIGYGLYGGRGIKVCERWQNFAKFYEDMGDRPQEKTLDRKDGNGDYCKDNCRWATSAEQLANRRKYSRSKANTTGVLGVYWKPSHGKFVARFTENGVRKYLGFFRTLDEARRAIEATAL